MSSYFEARESHDLRLALSRAEDGYPTENPNLYVYPEIGSTMTVLDRLIADNKCYEGVSVIALKQTDGRGGDDPVTGKPRVWWDGSGNVKMSLAVKAFGYTKEVEFIAGFTIAEIMADQLQRATVQLKFPNDVLVNDEKISGCIALMNEENYHCPEGRLVNLGVGVNLATKPPADVMRQQGSITAGTCLKEHDVAMDIADFVTLFKAKFRENMNDYRCSHGFETILKRIGFADQNGNIALTSHETGDVVTGTYAGFKTEKIGPKLYKGYILLNTDEGVKPYAMQEYSTRAVIKSDAAVGSTHNGTVQADLRIG